MKKALVMGANGYLGRHIAQCLEMAGFELTIAGREPVSRDAHENYLSLDFSKLDQVQMLDLEVDYVFFFAGLTGTAAGFDRYLEFVGSNDIALLNLLRHHHRSCSRARIIFPSSRLVYRGEKDQALGEDALKDPKTIYAQNKLTAEAYLRMYQNRYGIPYTVFRICVPYGNRFDDSYSYGTIGFFLDKARSGEDIPLYGDGSQRRTFTHIDDICAVVLGSLEKPGIENSVYNIGGGDHLSLAEAAALVAKKFSVDTRFVEWPQEASLLESGDTVFDASKLDQVLDYDYPNNLTDWLASLPE